MSGFPASGQIGWETPDRFVSAQDARTDPRRLSRNRGVIVSWAVVGIAGLTEGVYGRTEYLGDAISYLNVSRAVSALDWAQIFNPMWNPGYPALIALARAVAPSTADGEWYAITLLNWIIFLGAFAAWRYLIRAAIMLWAPASAALDKHPAAVWTTSCVFLGCNLGLDKVSSVYPDLLVTTLFLAAAGQLLCLFKYRRSRSAVLLGAALGLGVWAKGVFAPFACFFLFALCLDCWAMRSRWRLLAISSGVFGVLFGFTSPRFPGPTAASIWGPREH